MKTLFALLCLFQAVTAAEFFAGTQHGIFRITPENTAELVCNPGSVSAMIMTKECFFVSGRESVQKVSRNTGIADAQHTLWTNVKGKRRVIQYCHLCLSPDGKFLYGADYSGRSFAEFPLAGGKLCPPRIVRVKFPKGVHKRQNGSHPHFVGFDPSGEFLVAADLGGNCLLSWRNYEGRGIAQSRKLESKLSPDDAGPRQIAFSKDGKFAFSINELSNSIGIFSYSRGKFTFLKDLPLLDKAYLNKSWAGALKLSPDGKVLIAANRGADTLSVIAVDGAKSRIVQSIPCGGKFPGDLLFVEKDKLAVANVRSGNIRFFAYKDGRLTALKESVKLPDLTCLAKEQ